MLARSLYLTLALALAGEPATPDLCGPNAQSAEVPGGKSPRAVTIERRLAAMGTYFDLEVSSTTRARALQASERAVQAVEACAQRLSTWSEASELAAFNAAPIGQALVEGPLFEELARCLELHALTGGAFDPAIGRLVTAWDLRGEGRVPTDAERATAVVPGGLSSVLALESTAQGSLLRKIGPGQLEEGGFGKGAGLDRALAALAAEGVTRARLDLGGQVALLSADPRAEPFEVALADPIARALPVVVVELSGGSLATTGNSERGISVDGVRFAHVLDPRHGRPATDFGSLSVWAPSAFTADALSTGLYVLGPDAALAWAEQQPDVEVIVLETLADGSLRARLTRGLEGRVRSASDIPLVTVSSNSLPNALQD